MKLRALHSVLIAALLVSGGALASPASAAPAAPVIVGLSTATPDRVTGTVTSDQPYVVLWLSESTGDSPTTVLTLAESNAFDVPTWGYGRFGTSISLVAVACPTPVYDAGACSSESYEGFYPSQLVPEVTWPTDTKIGVGDPDPVITITDPGGSGEFNVIQYGSNITGQSTPVTAGVPTSLTVADTLVSTISLYRCSTDRVHCRQYAGNTQGVSLPIAVQRDLHLQVDPIKTVYSDRDSAFRLTTGAPGTAEVTWHVERTSAPGTAVGPERTSSVVVDEEGYFAPIVLPRDGLSPATNGYVVAGTVDLASTDFGAFESKPFTSAPFTVSSAPAVTWSANYKTIYPNVNTKTYPGKVTWYVKGLGGQDLSRIEVWSSADEPVNLGLTMTASSSGVIAIQWNGKRSDGKTAPSGYYKAKLWDAAGDPVNVKPIIRVDARRLVTKQWVKTVSAAGSVVGSYVGRCSTLRKPAGRGWTYSLGFWANTKCSTTGATASLVSTVHAIRLPKVAGNYASVRVSMYGGAATSKPRSRGVIRYLTAAGKWTSETVVTYPLGYHSGLQRTASGMIFSDRSFAWGFYTLNSHRYDVKNFTVVVRYNALG